MPMRRTKLLIVDDEMPIRTSLTHILAKRHSVRSAGDGFAALADMRQEVPDIILSDLNMPGMSGFEFLSVIRRRFPAILVIAMSGAFTGDDIPDGVIADAFYEKGTYLGSLLQMLEGMGSPERTSRPRPSAPIWIASNGHDPAGEAYVMISCPECLRTFPQVLETAAHPVLRTTCIHCQGVIHYAIVPPTMAATAQSIQRQKDAAIPTFLNALNLTES